MVRVPLHGRRVGGWVVALGPPDGSVRARPARAAAPSGPGLGPSADIIELARWASQRWGAGRLRPFMVAGSPPTHRRIVATVRCCAGTDATYDTPLPRLLRLPPADDPMSIVDEAVARGAALVIHPSVDEARRLAARLRQAGYSTALHPDQWARAASRGRRGDRRAKRGLGAVRRNAIDRRARRTRRGPAGRAIADVACPRRRDRTGTSVPEFRAFWCRRARRRWHCVGPAIRSGGRRSVRSAPAGRSSSSSIARTRSRGSDHCSRHRSSSTYGERDQRVDLRAQHEGSSATVGMPHVQVVAALRALRGIGRAGRHRLPSCAGVAARFGPSCVRTAAPERWRCCGRASAGCARRSRRRQVGRSVSSPARASRCRIATC